MLIEILRNLYIVACMYKMIVEHCLFNTLILIFFSMYTYMYTAFSYFAKSVFLLPIRLLLNLNNK